MPNEKLLKAKIIEKGLSIKKIAKEMGLSAYTLGKKLSGKTVMTLAEARFLQRRLDISDQDFSLYFFTLGVA